MNTTKQARESDFSLREYLPELITSLLYASAISAILSFSMSLNQDNNDIIAIINTFLIIFLIFADWNSRILVPLHFPPQDLNLQRKPFFQYSKLILEIISMVFLVLFYSYLLKENFNTINGINIYTIFTFYLFACGVWNLLMIRIMNGINVKPLRKSILNGSVFDLPDLKDYTNKFVEKVKDEEKELDKMLQNDVNDSGKDNVKSINAFMRKKAKLALKINLARTIAQFIGNHILWANFWVGILIVSRVFLNTSSFDQTNINIGESISISLYSVKIAIILILGFIFFLILFNVFKLNNVKILFGLSLFIFLLLFYTLLSEYCLIYVMIIQQIIIGLLIEFITDRINLQK